MDVNTGIYSLCGNGSNAKTLECCINRCSYPVKFCVDTCHDIYKDDSNMTFRCLSTCKIHHQLCIDNCKVASWDSKINPFIQCAKDEKCWDTINAVECVIDKKQQLLDCCYGKCANNSKCELMCDETYKVATTSSNVNIYSPQIKKQTEISWILVVFAVGISMLIILFNIDL